MDNSYLNTDVSKNLKWKYFFVSVALFIVYLFGVQMLSHVTKMSWGLTPVFWIYITQQSLWIKLISMVTIASGAILIYFVPGIFIAKALFKSSCEVEVFAKGFLINCGFLYITTTAYKILFRAPVSREMLVITIGALIFLSGVIFVSNHLKTGRIEARDADKKFSVVYILIVVILLFSFSEKIFMAPFGNNDDGANHYWLAQSVQTNVLPTDYNEPKTLLPYFSFAPCTYLSMYALVLFGHAEFIMKIGILIAFVCMGFILKAIVKLLNANQNMKLFDYIPLILYLVIFFTVVSYRADYFSATDLAKSSETIHLALFLTGFYFWLKKGKSDIVLPLIFFLLAAMTEYSGGMMIFSLLVLYSLFDRDYKMLKAYIFGGVFLLLVLNIFLLPSSYKFGDMFFYMINDIKEASPLAEGFEVTFLIKHFLSYFILTAGLSVFFVLGRKKKHCAIMGATTLIYMLMPLKTIFIPAHFYVPIFMFPLLGYYSWKSI